MAKVHTAIILERSFPGANLEIKEFPNGEKVISPRDKQNPNTTTQSKLAGLPALVISANAETTKASPKIPIPNAVCLKILSPPPGRFASLAQRSPKTGPNRIQRSPFSESKKDVGIVNPKSFQFMLINSLASFIAPQ